jgi:hypothetical protein
MADLPGASISVSGDVPAAEAEKLTGAMQTQLLRGRIAPLSRETYPSGEEGPMNITPGSIPMHPSPKAPESYDGHPIEHAARHAKGRTPPVR